jgi:hypothetical protein
VRDGPNMSGTFAVRRKGKKRALPWTLTARDIKGVSPQEAEDIPAGKKPRREKPLSTTTDEAARKTDASPDISAGLPPPALRRSSRLVITTSSTGTPPPPPPLRRNPRRSRRQTQLPRIETSEKQLDTDDDDDDDDANAVLVTDTQPNAGPTRAAARWTPEEDAKLTDAVTDTRKKKHSKEHGIDWVAIAALVPGRTKRQCYSRWNNASLDPSIALTARRKGSWTKDEDLKLKNSVQMHGDKDWVAIAALVPGRTKRQCWSRWKGFLSPRDTLTVGRNISWTADEDKKLNGAVRAHGAKNWEAIGAMVPSRTRKQCRDRWRNSLDPSSGAVSGRTGSWTKEEDLKLKHSVQMHGGKDWAAISALVPGRTNRQCWNRWKWKGFLSPRDTLTARRKVKWTEDEDSKLKNSVQMHGGKDWAAIAAMVPGRTSKQCCDRWLKYMDSNRSTVWGK